MEGFSEKLAIRSYLRLMHELAMRVELVAYACDGKLTLTPPYAREYSYLQFRRICELMALGCLQLHGDLPVARTKAATKEWNAERIMRLLHRSHPHAFPQSVTTTSENGVWHHVANSKPNALTLSEFKTLYGECGDLLHRGTIRSIESEKPINLRDYEKVIEWQRKIVDLMNQHVVARQNGEGMYLVSLKSENGLPACSVFSDFVGDSVKVATYNLAAASSEEPEGGSAALPRAEDGPSQAAFAACCGRLARTLIWLSVSTETNKACPRSAVGELQIPEPRAR